MSANLRLLAILEFLVLVASTYAGVYVRFGGLATAYEQLGAVLPTAVVFAAVGSVCMVSMGLYGPRLGLRFSDTVARAGIAMGLAGVADAVVYYFWPAVQIGRGAQALALGVALVAVLVTRGVFYRFIQRRSFRSNVLVYGQGETAAAIAQASLDPSHRSYRIAGYVPVLGEVAEDICRPLVGQHGESLPQVARELGIHEIVVAVDNCRNRFPMKELLDCRLAGVKVTEVVSFTERESGKIDLDALRPSWLIYGTGFRQRTLDRMLKRCFDVVASALLLTVALPLMSVAMLAILVESRGRFGVFLRQERVGLHGRAFSMLKLRSMVPNAESDGHALWSVPGDRRVTHVGAVLRRFRIDELPQIINILRGEMSFVGPRPERPEFVGDLSRDLPFYDERHSVKPGLAGWAQLCYPYGASVADAREKLQYDLFYVKHQTPLLDLRILLETFEVVLLGRERPVSRSRPRAHPGVASVERARLSA